MTDDAQALESLPTHPGWRLFIAHVQREWGPNGALYNAELDKALDLTDANAAASQARQVRAGRKVIEALMAWPAEEAARLTRQPGAIDHEVESFSRRGRL